MQLEAGRSYIRLFYLECVVFIAAMAVARFYIVAGFGIAMGTMCFLFAFLLLSQIRSGIALDSWWVATHQRGTWQYTALIIWQCIGLAGMVAMTLFIASILAGHL